MWSRGGDQDVSEKNMRLKVSISSRRGFLPKGVLPVEIRRTDLLSSNREIAVPEGRLLRTLPTF